VTVTDLDADIRRLFGRFNTDEGADLFHDTFLSLDPTSVHVLGREQLRAALPRRRQLFDSVGAGDPELVELDVDRLDSRHALARSTWHAPLPDDRDPLVLAATYLLREEAGEWRVVLYLNHQDVVELLREAAARP
jgi:hypothetical protein